MTLLKVENLKVSFNTDKGSFFAVDDVSFGIDKGEALGLVGESGCGKSVTALSILRLIPAPDGRIEKGSILFKGNELLKADARKMRNIRGKSISMIFQEPVSALSPLHRIGKQIVEGILLHEKISKKDALQKALKWLQKVGIPAPDQRIYAYPHQLSGGMQQRVMIAMALMMKPSLIIADEPTTALDVTIQAQIFDLIREIKEKNTSILLITHDMGVVWEMCDRVLVMYASKIVETGTREDIFKRPAHPYTKGLLKSIPRLTKNPERLKAIPGSVPWPLDYPAGCRFNDRCPEVIHRCRQESPPIVELGPGRQVSCFLAGK